MTLQIDSQQSKTILILNRQAKPKRPRKDNSIVDYSMRIEPSVNSHFKRKRSDRPNKSDYLQNTSNFLNL